MERIGFIGLGIMGRPMACNLVRAGFPVTVWNRSRSGMDAVAEAGAVAAAASATAEASDVLLTMVTDSPDVEAVLLGERGAGDGLRPGAVVIDMSTISPRVTRAIAARLAQRGVAMLDAPVSGGEAGAVAGTLSIMIGGEAAAVERCRPIFAALGRPSCTWGPSAPAKP